MADAPVAYRTTFLPAGGVHTDSGPAFLLGAPSLLDSGFRSTWKSVNGVQIPQRGTRHSNAYQGHNEWRIILHSSVHMGWVM